MVLKLPEKKQEIIEKQIPAGVSQQLLFEF
jgi:hypothetical protein